MKNKKIYVVNHATPCGYKADSFWSSKKLAEKRLSDIKEEIKECFKDNNYLIDLESYKWFIQEIMLNHVEEEKVYE